MARGNIAWREISDPLPSPIALFRTLRTAGAHRRSVQSGPVGRAAAGIERLILSSINWQVVYLLTSLLTILMIASLGFHAWRFRRWSTGMSFVMLAVCGLGWSLTVLVMALSPVHHAPVWMNLKSLFIHLSIIALLFYVLAVTGQSGPRRGRLLVALLVIPVGQQLLLWTSSVPDGWVFRELTFARTDTLTHVNQVVYGPAYWISSAQGYGLSILCIAFLLGSAYRAGPLMKKQAAILAFGVCAPVVANAMLVTHMVPRIYDPMPYGIAVLSLAMWWAVIRHQIVDLVPIARNMLVDAMDDAVLALDAKGRVIDANAAMEKLLGVQGRMVLGMSVEALVPKAGARSTGLTDWLTSGQLFQAEPSSPPARLAVNPVHIGERSFKARVIVLPSRDNKPAGRLLMLTDVTEQANAEAAREASLAELTAALAQVRTLRGLLPMCASCKKVKDVEGKWRPVDEYISANSEADLTHGVCPTCEHLLYSQYSRSGAPPRYRSELGS